MTPAVNLPSQHTPAPASTRTPLKRKRATPRRVAATCEHSNRCKRRPSVTLDDGTRLCRTHAVWLADKLVGDSVKARDRRCMFANINDKPCEGPLQWCHLIRKARYPALRWDTRNSVSACRSHHSSFDNSPIEAAIWCEHYLGDWGWRVLQHDGLNNSRPPVAEVIATYRERVA